MEAIFLVREVKVVKSVGESHSWNHIIYNSCIIHIFHDFMLDMSPWYAVTSYFPGLRLAAEVSSPVLFDRSTTGANPHPLHRLEFFHGSHFGTAYRCPRWSTGEQEPHKYVNARCRIFYYKEGHKPSLKISINLFIWSVEQRGKIDEKCTKMIVIDRIRSIRNK